MNEYLYEAVNAVPIPTPMELTSTAYGLAAAVLEMSEILGVEDLRKLPPDVLNLLELVSRHSREYMNYMLGK